MAVINITADNVQNLAALATPVQGLVAQPLATPVVTSITTIDTALASVTAANTAGNTALPAPNNFRFFDETVGVSGTIPGDTFKGTTPGITAQFIDLTPDNIGITGLTPNLLMLTDTGDDVLIANGGRNILDAASGTNVFLGGAGVGSKDTFIADAAGGKTDNSVFNFHSGDDAAITGLNATDFTFALKDTALGLQISATTTVAGKNSAVLTIAGFSISDVGTKLSLGLNTSNPASYLFIHGN
jgi:hypothetical protein